MPSPLLPGIFRCVMLGHEVGFARFRLLNGSFPIFLSNLSHEQAGDQSNRKEGSPQAHSKQAMEDKH